MGVSENVVYPIVPNGFADHYPVMKNGYFIGNINPTFSDKPIWKVIIQPYSSHHQPDFCDFFL